MDTNLTWHQLLQAGIRVFYYKDSSLDARASQEELNAKRRLVDATNASLIWIE